MEQKPFNDVPAVEERSREHWNLWEEFRDNRNQTVRFFNKNGQERNIIDYVRDSVDRMNEFHLKPSYKEDWQNNVFDPITRDKLISILSQLASTRMKPELIMKGRSIFHMRGVKERKEVFQDLLEAANIHNRDEHQLLWEMYTAMTEGTVFGFESWKRETITVDYVTDYDAETGEKKTEKITYDAWDDVFGTIVPIDEFYPETIWVNNVRKLKKAFWVRNMSFSMFQADYGGFKNADKVLPAGDYREGIDFEWGISEDVDDRQVQVRMFFDELNDKMGIWANGVEIYYGCLPWNHKRLPFWSAQFELIHHQFLYGKSLPDKLMGMQDINNAVFNGMLDQLFLALNSPLIVDGSIDDLGEGYLDPGRVYEATPGTRVQRASIGQVDSSAFNMLALIKRSMEESSVSAQAQGVPSGGRKTKYEVQQLQEGALKLAGLFLQLMEYAGSEKYWMRMYNILQYYSLPTQQKDDDGNIRFKFVTLDNVKLPNGKIGQKRIQIVNSENERPNREELKGMVEREEGVKFDPRESRIQPIVITRDYLLNKDFDLEMKIVPNSSVKESEAQRKNSNIAFSQFAFSRPDLYDQEVVAREFAEAFDKPDDIVKITPQAAQPGQPGATGNQTGGPGLGTPPSVDVL